MGKTFNVNGDCKPNLHYMVDMRTKLEKIKCMIVQGQYFTINRARQYGKTTTLRALENYLEPEYLVVSIDFQMLSSADFENERSFVEAFGREISDALSRKKNIGENVPENLRTFLAVPSENATLSILFRMLSEWCAQSDRPVVLMIDEVDSAANNQIFLDFLAQMRGYYQKRDIRPTFQSVILAGVYDIKNLKLKIRSEKEHKYNSPWNIAADFDIDMSFDRDNIRTMLEEYEKDHMTGMDIGHMSRLIYDYTAGYPYLVSRLCQLIDERVAGTPEYPDKASAWTTDGFQEAVRRLLKDQDTLFDDMRKKITEYPELKEMLNSLLFKGTTIPYNPDNYVIDIGKMFGFIKEENGNVVVANRIFETRLYNMFLSEELLNNITFDEAVQNKNQFVQGSHLNMELVMQKFMEHYTEVYADHDQKFLEENGRRLFLLYLKPIINGTGNYYVEARTRNMKRTDVIVDYLGERYVIELKLWHGEEYNRRGEKQLAGYLEEYHLKKGYLLSFNFNKNKQIGMKKICCGDKMIIEVVV